jgi:hypothetical protein
LAGREPEAMNLKAEQSAVKWMWQGTKGFLGLRKKAGARQLYRRSLEPDE